MNIYAFPLSRIALITIISVCVWAAALPLSKCALKKWGGTLDVCRLWRILNYLLFAAALIAIFTKTLFFRTPDGDFYFGWLRTPADFRRNHEYLREMVMNAFLFLPLGLFAPHSVFSKTRHPTLYAVISGFLLSAVIEVVFQFALRFGVAELSDIIMNTIGAATGAASFLLFKLIDKKLS